jgi:hypothetical protein
MFEEEIRATKISPKKHTQPLASEKEILDELRVYSWDKTISSAKEIK